MMRDEPTAAMPPAPGETTRGAPRRITLKQVGLLLAVFIGVQLLSGLILGLVFGLAAGVRGQGAEAVPTALIGVVSLIPAVIATLALIIRDCRAGGPVRLRTLGLVRPSMSTGRMAALVLLGFLGVRLVQVGLAAMGHVLSGGDLSTLGEALRDPPIQDQAQPLLGPMGPAFLLTLVYMALIAPWFEEVMWRGYVQTALVAKMGAAAGIAVTAVLFATIHFNVAHWFALLALSVVLGLLAHRTGSLWPSIALHALNNWLAAAALLTLAER